ncbi:MAG: Uma2 family endonuclease [Hyphomicrobium sp.]
MTGFAEEKSARYAATLSKAEFYRWVVHQPRGRYEFKDGTIVQQMTCATKPHNRIVSNFIGGFRSRLDLDVWSITSSDLAVEIENDVRYPDLVVERLDASGSPLVAEQAVVLVEVLSPSSIGTDMVIKLAEYTSLASLEAYIVASQDEPILWVWQRSAETRAFSPLPAEIKGRDASLEIAALAVSLPLAELYRGIGTT